MNGSLEPEQAPRLPTLRDLIAPVFRYRRAGLLTAAAVMLATIIMVAVAPTQYESEMKFLVKRERAETLVSAEPSPGQQGRTDVSEDELNSEVEVLKGRDLLEQVAVASGLLRTAAPDANERPSIERARAVRSLMNSLRIAPMRKSTLIQVTYASSDPVLAARVLSELARLYLEKHLALHRPPGAYQFFSEQAEHFRAELVAAEASLREYGRREQVVSGEIEKESTLRQAADFEGALQQTQAAIVDANRRVTDLEQQIATTPARQTTDVKTSDNAVLTGELKSRVLNLEMKRADLLRKFKPNYPPVVEAEGQLEQARAALAETTGSPLKEETTGQNPTHQWLLSELARVRTERSAAVARIGAVTQSVRLFRERARELEEKGTAQQDLRRAMKTAEENYLLYQKKQEEARISDALDRTRIANVVVAEAPTVPSLPSNTGRFWLLTLGAVLSVVLALTVTYILAYVSPYMQTPDDVENTLGVPVLASLSARQ
jgi:uncharacterized protein involved in exopolysaccharide biosynthesis